MKNKRLLGLILATLICGIVNAQSFVAYTWDTYKMKFKIADDMTVAENDADKFEASCNRITMDIYPRKGENLNYERMKSALVNWANQEGFAYAAVNANGDEQPIYLKNLNGYWGCAIDGTKNGFSATMLLLVDPGYPDISFYVWISYNSSSYDEALQVLKSFQPM